MHRALLAAGCAVLFVASAFGQQGAVGADPLTGNWGANGVTLLELRYDGKQTVSGTAIWRHEDDAQRTPIESGSFDAQSGALKLEGDVKNREGKNVRYLIEGKLDGGTLSGTFRVGEETGQFSFTRQ